MARQTKVRELLLYSEKIGESDVKNLFNQVLKSTMPFLGFIDFRDFCSINFINIITKRKLNTVQFFAKERKALADVSLLVFPYKVAELSVLDCESGSMFPFPKIYIFSGNQDFLSLALKEKIVEVDLKISKVLGKLIGVGTAVDEHGKKSIIISATPERFFMVELEKNPSVYIEILDPIPKRMSVTSKYPVFEETGITVGTDNYDIFQHTLIIGASGTGKSKGLYALIKSIQALHGNSIRMVLIDPHGEFVKMFPNEKIVDLVHNYIEPLDLGGNKTPLMTQLISQLLSSAIGGDNKYSERVLFYAVHLLSSIDQMNLKNVSLLLTDSSKRAEFVSSVENDEIKRFFDEEFNDIYIHHFNDAILPVLNFVGEYELYLGGDKKKESLLDLINRYPITVVSFNPNFFGKRMINFLAGAVINQMYILAITEKLKIPTILVMDEFQRVETKVVKDMLSETRKFNLYAYLSMQYLGQLSKEVHDSIVSNIRNIISFKLNKQDATMISSIMEIKIEESFKKARTQTELEESKKEMFVRLHQRECIVRLFDGKKYILPMKLKVVDVARWGYNSSMELSQMDAKHDNQDVKEAQQGMNVNVRYGNAGQEEREAQPIAKEEPAPEENKAAKPAAKAQDMKEKLMGIKLADEDMPFKREREIGEDRPALFKDEEENESAQEEEKTEEAPAEEEREEPAEEKPEEEAPTRRKISKKAEDELLNAVREERSRKKRAIPDEELSEEERHISSREAELSFGEEGSAGEEKEGEEAPDKEEQPEREDDGEELEKPAPRGREKIAERIRKLREQVEKEKAAARRAPARKMAPPKKSVPAKKPVKGKKK